MISVDIFVPILDRSYDFSLSEEAPVGAIIEEVAEMICQKEHWPAPENVSELTLSCPLMQKLFSVNSTLGQAGVTTGMQLILA